MPGNACLRCRRMKYRCENIGSQTSCRRCLTSNSLCEIPNKNVRYVAADISLDEERSSEDLRIANLERSVDELRFLVSRIDCSPEYRRDSTSSSSINAGSCDINKSRRLFKHCREVVFAWWRIVRIPSDKSYEDVLMERPLLHDTMISVAALALDDPDGEMFFKLSRDRCITAHIEESCRSMDLLQSFLLLSTWSPRYDRATLLRNSTFAHMAFLNATEMCNDNHFDELLWDGRELDRSWMYLYVATNNTHIWQRQTPSVDWTEAMQRSLINLFEGQPDDVYLAYFGKAMAIASRCLRTPMVTTVYRNLCQEVAGVVTALPNGISTLFKLSLGSMQFVYMNLWVEKLCQQPCTDLHEQLAVTTEVMAEIQRCLQDIVEGLDKLIVHAYSGLPVSFWLKPLNVLVNIGRMCGALHIPELFESASHQIKDRYEILGINFSTATRLVDKIDTINDWYRECSSSSAPSSGGHGADPNDWFRDSTSSIARRPSVSGLFMSFGKFVLPGSFNKFRSAGRATFANDHDDATPRDKFEAPNFLAQLALGRQATSDLQDGLLYALDPSQHGTVLSYTQDTMQDASSAEIVESVVDATTQYRNNWEYNTNNWSHYDALGPSTSQ